MVYNADMFIKRCARRYKGKIYESWWAVESYRENGKVKHKYVANITRYSPFQRERIIKILNNPDSFVIEEMKDLVVITFLHYGYQGRFL